MHNLTRKYEKTMRKVIGDVLSGKLNPESYKEELITCVNLGYLTGIVVHSTDGGQSFIEILLPAVTYSGLQFYEFRHPNLKANLSLVLSIFASVLSLLVAFLSNYENILSTLSSWFGSGSSLIQ